VPVGIYLNNHLASEIFFARKNGYKNKHIHLSIIIPAKYSLSGLVKTIKGNIGGFLKENLTI